MSKKTFTVIGKGGNAFSLTVAQDIVEPGDQANTLNEGVAADLILRRGWVRKDLNAPSGAYNNIGPGMSGAAIKEAV